MTKDVNGMHDFQGGQRVKPSDLNAMLHACRATGQLGEGFSEDGGVSLRQRVAEYPNYYEFEGSMALGAIEPYSVFTIKSPSTHVAYPHRVDVAKVGASVQSSGLLLLTNRDIKIPAGCKGIAWPIAEMPLKVRVTGSTPTVGSPCGVEPDTYGVTSARSGLVCVSAAFVESAVTYVLVVAHNENVRFLGKATEDIDAADDVASYTTGSVKVVCLEGGSEVDAVDPATGSAPWLVTVRNYSTSAITSGDRVRFGAYHGCGFVLDKPVSSTTTPTVHFTGFRLYRETDGYRSDNAITRTKKGAIFWTNSIGDVAACQLEVKTSTASGYTSVAMKVLADGWYDFDWRITGYENIGAAVSGTDSRLTRTTEAGGAIAAHSHTFTGDAGTTGAGSGHLHSVPGFGVDTSVESAHTHGFTPTGTNANAGSVSAHTHDVKIPNAYDHSMALCRIYWRPAGGSDSSWDLIAFASTGSHVLANEWWGANGSPYHSAAPRGQIWLAADSEIAFKLQHAGFYPTSLGVGYTFFNHAAATNLTVKYLGNALPTASHYP